MRILHLLALLLLISSSQSCSSSRQSTPGSTSKQTAIALVDTLLAQAMTQLQQGEFTTADTKVQAAKQVCTAELGQLSASYANCMRMEGMIHYYNGNPEAVDSLWTKTLRIRREVLGTKDQQYLYSLMNVLAVRQLTENFSDAEALVAEAEMAFAVQNLAQAADGADLLENVGNFYYAQQQLVPTLSYYERVKNIRRQVLAPEDPQLGNSYLNMSSLLSDMGNYEQAVPLLDSVALLWLNNPAVNEQRLGDYYNNAAIIHKELGHYTLASNYFEKATALRKTVFGEDHYYYRQALLNHGAVYDEMGNYARSEEIWLHVLGYFENTEENESEDNYIKVLNNLSGLYSKLGDAKKAATLATKVLDVYQQQDIPFSNSQAIAQAKLAEIYQRSGNYAPAEELYQQSLASLDTFLNGEKNIIYLQVLSDYAALAETQGKHQLADSIYGDLMQIAEQFGPASLSAIEVVQLIADSKTQRGDFVQAAELRAEAKTRLLAGNLNRTPQYHQLLQSELRQAIISGKDHSISQQTALLANYRQLLEDNWLHLSPTEKEKATSTLTATPSLLLSWAWDDTSTEAAILAYDLALFRKGNNLQSAQQLQRTALSQTDTLLSSYYAEWMTTKRQLAIQYQNLAAETAEIQRLQTEAENGANRLARHSASFRQIQSTNNTTHQDIQRQLGPREASLEFFHFDYTDGKNQDSVFYAVTLLRGDGSPAQLIRLFEQEALIALLDQQPNDNQAQLAKTIYQHRGLEDDGPELSAEAIYQLIWAPLADQLSGVKTIYYSPSGLLHRFNLEALSPAPGVHLADRYEFHLLSSTREMAKSPDDTQPYTSTSAFLIGGVDYNQQQADSTAYTLGAISSDWPRSRYAEGKQPLAYLPGTAIEAQDIQDLLLAKQYDVQYLKGPAATERAVKLVGQRSDSPRILHFATHGYFFPLSEVYTTDQRNQLQLAKNPLLRSGLILAGGNLAWQGGQSTQAENGILTAYEINQFDLRDTELVVLSACETGLGDIRGSEGVFGLQRAFKTAGVKYLIMSLWKVKDVATQQLMVSFYEHYLQDSSDLPAAFRAAKQELRQRYPTDPSKWASFVLMQ